MRVEQILQTKGADVYAVSETSSVREAVDLLSDKNIGAVLVRNEAGGVAGIFSERDVVRRLRSDGAAILDARVRDCMTRSPHCCAPGDTVNELMSMMTEKRVRHLPVIDSGEIVGLVSIGDVVKRKIEETEQEAAALKEYIAS